MEWEKHKLHTMMMKVEMRERTNKWKKKKKTQGIQSFNKRCKILEQAHLIKQLIWMIILIQLRKNIMNTVEFSL